MAWDATVLAHRATGFLLPAATWNTIMDDIVDLDARYSTSGNFTPGMAFGGGTTGITYSSQNAVYLKIGLFVFFYGRLILTSKGSSTGAAKITGLPAAGQNAISAPIGATMFTSYSLASSLVSFQGYVQNGAQEITLTGNTAASSFMTGL